MKKSLIFLMSILVLISSIFSVIAFAETDSFVDDMIDDDMNVTSNTTTTKKSSSGLGGSDIGDFVGGVVSDVFQDEDVSEGVGDKVEGILGIFDNIDLGGIGDKLGSLGQTTQKSTNGSNFFDPINPVVTEGNFNITLNNGSMGNEVPTQNVTVGLNGDTVDYALTQNPYPKPSGELKPGDKGDGVKWLQWMLIYTNCGLQGMVTGEYDDATSAAVKQLQLTYNLTADGIASLEVIAKAEEMFNNYISGAGIVTTGSSVLFDTITDKQNSQNKTDKPTNNKVTAIIVGLIILWIFVIAAVAIFVYIKKKNISLNDDGEIVKPQKVKKEKNIKKSTAKNKENISPLRESKTLNELADDKTEFDVIDFDNEDYDEDGEVTLSSLYEMKKKAVAKKNSLENADELQIDTKEVTLKTEADFIPVKNDDESFEENSKNNSSEEDMPKEVEENNAEESEEKHKDNSEKASK